MSRFASVGTCCTHASSLYIKGVGNIFGASVGDVYFLAWDESGCVYRLTGSQLLPPLGILGLLPDYLPFKLNFVKDN